MNIYWVKKAWVFKKSLFGGLLDFFPADGEMVEYGSAMHPSNVGPEGWIQVGYPRLGFRPSANTGVGEFPFYKLSMKLFKLALLAPAFE